MMSLTCSVPFAPAPSPSGRPARRRINDIALGAAVGIRLEFEQFGLKQDHFQQLVHALLGERGNVHKNRIATPIIRHQPLVLQLLADFIGLAFG